MNPIGFIHLVEDSVVELEMRQATRVYSVDEVEKRLAYMFSAPKLQVTHYAGWFPIFAQLCFAIDAVLGNNKLGFRWIEIKGVLGTANFDFEIEPQAYRLHRTQNFSTQTIPLRSSMPSSYEPSASQVEHACSVEGPRNPKK